MEPCTWLLHNKLVDLANEPLRGKGHGNYYPSLDKAFDILNSFDKQNCALLLVMLSDGRPSDAASYFKRGIKAENEILQVVKKICSYFNQRLTFGAFGFAFDDGEMFKFLKEMTVVAGASGAKAIFSSGIDTKSLRNALRLLSTTLLSTRSNLSSIAGGSLITQKLKILRTEERETMKGLNDDSITVIEKSEYNFYLENAFRYSYLYQDRYGKDFVRISFQHPKAVGFAVKKKYFNKGAERLVFECTEVDIKAIPIGRPLVAKISLFHNDVQQLDFHKISGITQREAFRVANKFNKEVTKKNIKIPEINFLKVSFFVVESNEGCSYECSYACLVEDRLDSNRRYIKYNDNKGGVKDVNIYRPPLLIVHSDPS